MKRLQYDRYGGPAVMRLAEFEPRRPGPDEVLVRVRAAASTALDWKMRNGELKLMTGYSFPLAMGHDFAGVVETVGAGVTRLKAGDPVLGGARFRQAGVRRDGDGPGEGGRAQTGGPFLRGGRRAAASAAYHLSVARRDGDICATLTLAVYPAPGGTATLLAVRGPLRRPHVRAVDANA